MHPLALTQLTEEASAVWSPAELAAAVSQVTAGAVVAFLLYRFVRRVPWPRPFRLRFALLNLGAALTTGLLWLGLSTSLEGLLLGSLLEAQAAGFWLEYLFLGVFLYAVVAGVTYSVETTARTAHAEAVATRAQLAALRAQIHPHFLFNALHAVVQLIPTEPARAAEAAELVASLLRTTLEEERDEVALREEWDFVSRYLEVERMRFGDRLRVRVEFGPDLLDARLPAFALHTLVENAVRHGVAPRVAPTEVVITAAGAAYDLTLVVRNTGDSQLPSPVTNGVGTGLTRLRERLDFLYGTAARLTCGAAEGGGFEAVVVVPRNRRES